MKDRADYWNQQYINQSTGWDMGYASPPIMKYFTSVKDKSLRILIPGGGYAWEVEQLWKLGFQNVFLLDFSHKALSLFRERVPNFPEEQIIEGDFFKHESKYDIIVEQTFFSSFEPSLRAKYVEQIARLLVDGGKLAGLLFNHEFTFSGPPYGGNEEDYLKLFQPSFHIKTMELCYNSIKPRLGRELFIQLYKET
ncbi:methyltransferase domain-containing protein [Lentimicrobium sp. S6]|uniref:methyltransferase domain-containing protein n=1 Tax=Lentimicrobium sp. S6 TaxID=2735872 RepID=UPI001552FE98|nr:methyltransferase domain-containing protein [Lentimicrobium sp. S6]NPD44188.1 methyltransferase domain-containing protein [Lentimicrobium sp. S6]